MGYIYLITNKINGKKYIGKTTKTIEKRWHEHFLDSKKNEYQKRPLYRAIKKYGIENFVINQLEECSNNNLSEQEKYWIQYYDTYKNGYNATLGGDGRISLDYEKIAFEYSRIQNMAEVANICECSYDSVYDVLKNLNIKTLKIGDVLKNKFSKPILQYTKQGQFIAKYNSVDEAISCLGLTEKKNRMNVSRCANGKRKSAYGFVWEWEKENQIV